MTQVITVTNQKGGVGKTTTVSGRGVDDDEIVVGLYHVQLLGEHEFPPGGRENHHRFRAGLRPEAAGRAGPGRRSGPPGQPGKGLYDMAVSGVSSSRSIYGNRNVITGLASGMDTESMIENAISAYKNKISALSQKRTKTEWKQDAYRSMISKMSSFLSKYTSYRSANNLMSSSFFDQAVGEADAVSADLGLDDVVQQLLAGVGLAADGNALSLQLPVGFPPLAGPAATYALTG